MGPSYYSAGSIRLFCGGNARFFPVLVFNFNVYTTSAWSHLSVFPSSLSPPLCAGRRGYPGQGRPGTDGEKGEMGVPGVKGRPGLPGEDGRDGEVGLPGLPGENGSQGPKGEEVIKLALLIEDQDW